MKVDFKTDTLKLGLLFKKTAHEVMVRVFFTEEERATLEAIGLWEEDIFPIGFKGKPGLSDLLKCSPSLLAHDNNYYGACFELPGDAAKYQEAIKQRLVSLKEAIEDSIPAAQTESFEL